MSMNMNELMKQAQQMQAEMQRLQEEAASETVEASAGGGMVTVKANGAREIVSVSIKPEAIDASDPEMLEDLIVAATNEALRAAERMLKAKLGSLMGGLGLGGLGLPGM
jgi:DNA-binding YbaB/EbfC family protein